MRSRLLAAAAAATLPFALAGVAGAQSVDDFTITPTSGPPGTTITVTGTCVPDPEFADEPFVATALLSPADDVLDEDDADLSPAGAFSLSLTVPAGSPASADYLVVVECYDSPEDEDPFFGGEEGFTVTAAPTPSPSPSQTASPKPTATASPTAKPSAKPTAAAQPKSAATAVKKQPTYTG